LLIGIGLSFAMKNLLKYSSFLISIVVFISCGNNQKKVPEDIIVANEMVEVITEIELTQALIKLKFSNQDTVNQQQLFNEVYKDFNVSEEAFNNSLTYYSKKPKLLEEIYVKVINNISKKQAKNQ
jgi:hypothetical protein